MNPSFVFRRTLANRILALIAVTLPTAPGCESTGSTDGCDPDPIESEVCIAPADAGAADGGSSQISCPSRDEARPALGDATFSVVDEVKSDGTVKDGECCYVAVTTRLCMGRPYLVNETTRTAEPIRGGAARANAPSISELDPTTRQVLAEQWTRDGLLEHASVASFGRFALELLAVGAPDDLVEEAHRAALDEVRHTRLCFALANAYANETVAPGPFPFDGNVAVTSDLASIATRTAREGCIGETVAAAIAAEQLACTKEPAVRDALATIAADEARHAELAWRTGAWAIRTGGPSVTRAVAEVFAAMPIVQLPEHAGDDLADHGRLGSGELRRAADLAIAEIIRPAAVELLAQAASLAFAFASSPLHRQYASDTRKIVASIASGIHDHANRMPSVPIGATSTATKPTPLPTSGTVET